MFVEQIDLSGGVSRRIYCWSIKTTRGSEASQLEVSRWSSNFRMSLRGLQVIKMVIDVGLKWHDEEFSMESQVSTA